MAMQCRDGGGLSAEWRLNSQCQSALEHLRLTYWEIVEVILYIIILLSLHARWLSWRGRHRFIWMVGNESERNTLISLKNDKEQFTCTGTCRSREMQPRLVANKRGPE